MAKTIKNGITYINGIPLDEFNKRCRALHEQRFSSNKTGKKPRKPYKSRFSKVDEWDAAFSTVKKATTDKMSLFIPLVYDSKSFPVFDSSFGCVSFEGYVATVLQPGKEYSIGDLVHLFRPILDLTPSARKMMEDTLSRLLAWGVLTYSQGYRNFKRTSTQFVNLVTYNDIDNWGELNLYTPEGKLITTYNTEGENIIYVVKTYTSEYTSNTNMTDVDTTEENSVEQILENFSEDMSFSEALTNLGKVALRTLRRLFN